VSARRPGPEFVGVAYCPDAGDPVACDLEREHRHGDAVLPGYQAGLAVDRALQDRHVAGCPGGEVDDIAGAIYHDRYQRTGDGWKFTERVYEIRYLDTTPLAGSAPHAAGDAR